MASIAHLATGLAAGRLLLSNKHRPGKQSPRPLAMVILSLLSIAPDIDVVAFRLGIPYSAPFGHRGVTHSLMFALMLGVLAAAAVHRLLDSSFWRTAVISVLTIASHPLLDAMTDGGLGVALAWPFSNARFFAPVRFIPVAPIGAAFLSGRGLHIALIEFVYFAPVFVYALWPRQRQEPSENP